MVERGERRLTRRDHVNALALALRVSPAEIAPSMIPGFDEWAPPPPQASAFPPAGDDIAVARHERLAREFMTLAAGGDTHAASIWLRRIARDPSVSPWLLLDQLAARETGLPGCGHLRAGQARRTWYPPAAPELAEPTAEGARTG